VIAERYIYSPNGRRRQASGNGTTVVTPDCEERDKPDKRIIITGGRDVSGFEEGSRKIGHKGLEWYGQERPGKRPESGSE
jgi:hypothetical protein